MAFGKDTYQSQGGTTPALELRESLLSILKDISPNEDNYFISNLGVAPPAMNTLHEWNLFQEARATSVSGNVEGAATTYVDLQVEERSNNRTVILDSPVRLSRTRASIANVTGEDAMGVEKERALRRLKSEMEYATVMGTIAAGQTDTARGMAGITYCISTNVTAHASAKSFTETDLNNIVQASWDTVGASYVMDVLAAPVVIKRRIASFGTNLTRNVEAYDKKLTQEVRVYDAEVGQTVKIIAHKDINAAAGTLHILGIREELFEHSFLTNTGEPHWEERAKDGDRENGVYITEFTMVSFNEHAHVKTTGWETGL
jgi:hypothetical protein